MAHVFWHRRNVLVFHTSAGFPNAIIVFLVYFCIFEILCIFHVLSVILWLCTGKQAHSLVCGVANALWIYKKVWNFYDAWWRGFMWVVFYDAWWHCILPSRCHPSPGCKGCETSHCSRQEAGLRRGAGETVLIQAWKARARTPDPVPHTKTPGKSHHKLLSSGTSGRCYYVSAPHRFDDVVFVLLSSS